MKKLFLITLSVVVFLIAATGCKKTNYRVNVSGIDVDISIKRLENDLFSINPNAIIDSVNYLRRKYKNFLTYFSYVINIGEVSDSSWGGNLVKFCTDKLNNEVYGSTIKVFPEVNDLERGLTDAFRHYRYYFPSGEVPGVYTTIAGFNSSIITGDSTLGIGLDRYLGSECKYYQRLMLYKYQTARMNPENVVPDCIYGWASSEWSADSIGYEQDNIFTEMMHQGKLYYYTRCMLPETKEELVFGFSKSQLEFCRSNEGRMWQYMVENNLLFSNDQLARRKLTGEAAFTSYFSTESPGRAALWIGFRIVESYMSANRNVTLEMLMKEKDVQSILEKARYRPPAG